MAKTYWERLLIAIGVLMYLFVFPHGIHGDAHPRYEALVSFLETGKLSPIPYSYVHPLFSAPLFFLGKILKDSYWWVSRFNAFLFLGTVWYAAHFCRLHLKWDAALVRRLVLMLLAATMFPKHVTDYYPEVFSACFVLLAILFHLENKAWLAIIALSLSVWNVIGTAPAGAAVLAYFAFRTKQWRYLAALPLLALGFLLENFFKFGDFYPHAYLNMQYAGRTKSILPYAGVSTFGYPYLFGWLSILFSFGRGLIFFTPGLLALLWSAIWKKRDLLASLIVAGSAYFLGLMLVYGKFWAWYGGWFWGPRYFLFCSLLAVFALIALERVESASLLRRVFCFFALALSLWVACQGVLFGQDFLEDCYVNGLEREFFCHYVPEYSPLWRFFTVLPPIRGRKIAYLVYFCLVAATLLAGPGRALLQEMKIRLADALRKLLPLSEWRF